MKFKLDNLEKINEIMEEYFDGYDPKITKLYCNHFTHEVEMIHEDEENTEIVYQFIGCFRVQFKSAKYFNWMRTDENGNKIRGKELNTGKQMQCDLFSTDVLLKTEDEIDYYVCNINMNPTYAEIWCRDIKVFKREIFKS